MTETFSPKLRAAMKEIERIVAKHNCSGVVCLADGLGHGEFKNFFDKPTWSQLRYLPIEGQPGAVRVHAKLHMKSKPQETQRTTNAMLLSLDMLGQVWLMCNEICKKFEQVAEIEKGDGVTFGHGDEDEKEDT